MPAESKEQANILKLLAQCKYFFSNNGGGTCIAADT
jgi:hypothetical protein